VAKELLGKVLVRRIRKELAEELFGIKKDLILAGIITETEAYFGEDDPASVLATRGRKFGRLMHEEPGITFIYMVHANWLLNIVAHPAGEAGAVLIRSIKPISGVAYMKRLRGTNNDKNLTNGPGKLTKALYITKELNGIPVYRKDRLWICDGPAPERIYTSRRIGVRRDLNRDLRFYILI